MVDEEWGGGEDASTLQAASTSLPFRKRGKPGSQCLERERVDYRVSWRGGERDIKREAVLWLQKRETVL